jgi:putative transposase
MAPPRTPWPHAPLHQLHESGTNHCHFVGHAPATAPKADGLSDLLSVLHAKTAGWLNRLERAPGRQVWFNFRETRLTYARSYFARLNYVHQNPVHHGLVRAGSQYPWCSAAWFERESSPATVKTIYGFKTDHVRMLDDFEVSPE